MSRENGDENLCLVSTVEGDMLYQRYMYAADIQACVIL